MDIVASIVNLVAIRTSSRPADEDHAYGHGKAESLAGIFQSTVIAASGVFLIYEGAIIRIINQVSAKAKGLGLSQCPWQRLSASALVLPLNRWLAKPIRGNKIDAVHYKTDITPT